MASCSIKPRGEKGFYVQRTRVQDLSTDHALGHPNKTGEVKYSRVFPTHDAAEREASAWRNTGDWQAIVCQGAS